MDESISRWYGHGGDWINIGLPMYVAMERKPENGAGIMLRLRIHKTKAVDSIYLDPERDHESDHLLTGLSKEVVLVSHFSLVM